MAQHDYNIANQSFPSFRTDLNNVLSAVNSSNSGTSRPSGAVEGTIWLDTTVAATPTLKFYDGSDDITFATFNTTANTVNVSDSAFDIVTDTTPQLGGDLDVNGNANISDCLEVNKDMFVNRNQIVEGEQIINGNSFVSGNQLVKGKLEIEKDLTAKNLQIDDSVLINNNLRVNKIETEYLSVTNNIDIANNKTK